MKIKQKGIATAAIAVVVIVVIAVVGVGAFLVLRERAPAGVGGLPVYGGASKASTIGGMGSASDFLKTQVGKGTDVPADVDAEAYTATGSISDILGWYRTEMANAGWTKLYDNTFDMSWMDYSMSIGLLYFEKETRAAAVFAVSYTYQGETYTYFGLVEGPKTVFDTWMGGAGYIGEGEIPGEGEEEGLPSSDQASGTEPLTRYPGSVMLSHGTSTYMGYTAVVIEYGTTASVDTVVNWYKTTALAGWTSVIEYTEEGATTLSYIKDTEYAVITVSPDGYTTIQVVHYTTG